ncbi:hypothetical protein [Melittangium boletus]|uniref:Uncharacterized protein n=1 Tax=Melittangium boletus DSM 14713 TaxID=1294270 RepID=A0A250IF47_9BACT|nr:hypothetical protein [Melittangium boletus]ATB29868.1 hypothetical protein MEBOL_003323 [Melittangium boletus DSM 14713]
MRRPLVLSLSILFSLTSACGGDDVSRLADIEPTTRGGIPGPAGPRGEPGPAGPAGQYARIKVVPPGSTPERGGENLREALAAILSPSATEPWLVFLEPGVYDLGGEALHLRPFVYLQGAGAGLTTVRSHSAEPTFVAAADTEVGALTVENMGGSPHAVALSTPSANFRARDVVALAHDGVERTVAIVSWGVPGAPDSQGVEFTHARAVASSAQGVVKGFDCQDCSVRLASSSFLAQGGGQAFGIAVHGGSLEVWDSSAEGLKGTEESIGVDARGSSHVSLVRAEARGTQGPVSTGMRLSSSTATVRDSALAGTGLAAHQTRALDVSRVARLTYRVDVERSTLVGSTQVVRGAEGYSIFIGGSQLRGGQVEGNGMVACHGSYDENFTSPPAPACP